MKELRSATSSAFFCALGLLAACSEPPRETFVLRRLGFEDVEEAGRIGVRTLARIEAVELDEISSTPAGRKVMRVVKGVDAIRVLEGRQFVLAEGLPDEPFDRLALGLFAPAGGTMLVRGFAGGESIGKCQVLIPRAEGWQEFEVPLRWTHGTGLRSERLVLTFPSARKPPAIAWAEFRSGPRELWLPAPARPERVELAEDMRLAVGLASGSVLETRVSGAAHCRLSFSAGLPLDLNSHQATARLRLSLLREGEVFETGIYPCPAGRWEGSSIDLGRMGAEPFVARFEIESGGAEAVIALLEPPSVDPSLEEAPTVILITSDTHRADHLGAAMRGVDVATPFLDSLAERGVFFEDCMSPTNITNPAHTSIMTALAVRDHGMFRNDRPASEEVLTLAEVLAEEGWATWAAVSVAHLRSEASGLGQGFDRFSAPATYPRDSSETIAALERWLARAPGAPLFVWLHIFDAHGPYEPPAPYDAMYWSGETDPRDPERLKWRAPNWAKGITDPEFVTALYRGEVSYLDARLEAFLASPRLARATVAVVADHGEHMLSHLQPFGHSGLAPATLEVPLILAGPGVPRGERVSRAVSSLDLARTLLDLAGAGARAFPGTNLLQEGPSSPPRFAISAHALTTSVQRDRWMLVQRLYAKEQQGGVRVINHEVRLHDIRADPDLTANLLDANPELALSMRRELVRWLLAVRPMRLVTDDEPLDEEARAQLAELGYTESAELPEENPWIDPACACEWCIRMPLEDG